MAQWVMRSGSGDNNALLLAVSCSVLLHAGLLLTAINLPMPSQSLTEQEGVSVRLLPPVPAPVDAVQDSVDPAPSSDAVEDAPGDVRIASPAPAPELEANEEAVPDAPVLTEENVRSVASADDEPLSDTEAVASESEPIEATTLVSSEPPAPEPQQAPLLPSVQSVRETVTAILEQEGDRLPFWAVECNPLQRAESMRPCQPEDTRDYQALERDPIYEFHNPPRQEDSYLRNLPTISSASPQLAARLGAADIPTGRAQQLMQELEASISLYSNPTDRRLGQLEQMTDKSDAGAQAREIMTPWVRLQMQLKRQEAYLTRQDRQEMEACTSLSLVLRPAKLAECALGGNPGLMLPLSYKFELPF